MNRQELNEFVAKKLGAIKRDNHYWDWRGRTIMLPNFCGSIEAAMEIVGNQDFMLRYDNKKWRCWFNRKKNDVSEDSAPMAIVMALISSKK